MATPMLGTLARRRIAGLVFLAVLAGLLGLTVAVYNKAFVDVVPVTLRADRVGNQLAPPADVKLRGMLVGEVRKVSSEGEGATVDLALKPGVVELIPSNVSARLLPKTLFGEKFVELVMPSSPARSIRAGDVIPQDRSETALELERVLDDIFPLLRTVKPAELSYTLNAFATALEGRGNALGDNLVKVEGYFSRFNEHLGPLKTDISELADFADNYDAAAPDLLRLLRNLSVTNATVVDQREQLAAFFRDTTGFADTADDVLTDNEDRLVALASTGRPVLELLAKYSPSYPCLLGGLARYEPMIEKAFGPKARANPMMAGSSEPFVGLHITLEVVRSRPAYTPDERPRFADDSGPNCRTLPDPPYDQGDPNPGADLDDGSRGPYGASESARPLPEALFRPTSGFAGTPAEQSFVNPLVAPVLGVPADEVPDVTTLLFGPMARGTAVRLS